MEYITLSDIKVHLLLDDIIDEDTYLESLGNSAESLALAKIGRTTEELTEMGTAAVSQFKTLALMIVADYYAQREASSTAQFHVTPAALGIICSLRKLKVQRQ